MFSIQYSPSALKINRCNRLCEVCQASFRALILKHLKGKRAHHCLRTQLASSHRCFEMPQAALALRRVSFIILLLLYFVCTYCLLCWATAGFVQTDEKNILLFILIHAVNNLSKPLPNIKGNSTKRTLWHGTLLPIQEILKDILSFSLFLSCKCSPQNYITVSSPSLDIIHLQNNFDS